MLPIAPDAWSYLWKLAALTLLFILLGWHVLAWIAAVLCAFTAYFFRDPDRGAPQERHTVVAPADGKVLRVESLPQDDFIGGPAVRVSIFLSIFNVHINRSPITGTILFQKHRAGQMLPAFKPHVSEENERNTLGLEGQGTRVLVHQITGLLARRIVCRVGPGDRVVQGQRFGLIKFGSCTEVVMPESLEVLVVPGDKVKGGVTPVARIPGGEEARRVGG